VNKDDKSRAELERRHRAELAGELAGETDEYHPESCPGECPGTCDYCGFWWCPYADEIAQCDKGCEGYRLYHDEKEEK
jgi:hypothetical protein